MPWHICVLCIIWAALCLELLVFILSPPSIHQSAKFTRSFKVSWVQGEGRPSLPPLPDTHTQGCWQIPALEGQQGLQLLRLSW